jgi:hypothetical protein
MGRRTGRKSLTQCDLSDTDGERAIQLRHAVHDVHRNGNFSGATLVCSKVQSIADDLLAQPDCGPWDCLD